MDQERLETLIVKFHNKQLNDNEKLEFESLLKNHAEARELFHTWNFINQSIEAFNIYEEIKDENILPDKNLIQKPKNQKIVRWLINVAAAIALPLVIATGYLYQQQNNGDIVYNEVTCSNGKVISILLSDSSSVRLFAGSTLRYPSKFSRDKRVVYLTGEANFEVKSNPEYPFIVSTIEGFNVKAYGTKFNVQDYSESDNILVYLDHGIVDFESPTLDKSITMSPSTELCHQKKSKEYSIRQVNSKEYDAYEAGVLVFTNRHLSEIVKKLEQVYKVKIEIEDNEELKNYRFTTTFRNESIYHILNILKMSSPGLDWKEEKGKIVLTKS